MKLSKEAYEYFAYSVLKQVVSRFPQLEKGESPDYYDDDEFGLEVTRAISTDDGEYDALINQYLNKAFSTIPENRLRKLGFIEGPVQINKLLYVQRSTKQGALYYYRNTQTNELILLFAFGRVSEVNSTAVAITKSIKEKLTKLNTNYKLKKRNALALILEKQIEFDGIKNDIISEELECCFTTIKELYSKTNELKVHFDSIYVIYLDTLFVIDTFNWEKSIICLDRDMVEKLLQEAGS